MEKEKKRAFKILVLGNSSVGKTTLISRYTKGFSPEQYITTIGVNITSYGTNIENNSISFQIFDIAGQTIFKSFRTKFYEGAYGALLLLDLTNIQSLKDIPNWIQEFRESSVENSPVVILGNKADLEKRTITENMIKEILDSVNISQELYLETSALNGLNVKESFELLGTLLLEVYK